jgi:hypothetical protein
VTLGERLLEIVSVLPEDWLQARVVVTAADPAQADAAAILLGSLSPGRSGATFSITVSPGGRAGPSVDAARRGLDRLEEEGIEGRVSLAGTAAFELSRRPGRVAPASLAGAWDDLIATFPADWSDAYLEIELASSADLDRAALLLGPVNPLLQSGEHATLRFRAAARFGYGAAPQMTRRVLARLDEEPIAGELRAIRVLSDTAPVATQGPVWRDGGRAV